MILIDNKKAKFHYEITDTIEAGLVLQGWEVKSLRLKQARIDVAWISVENDELWLCNAYISPWKNDSHGPGNENQKRKLLLNKREILKLAQSVKEKSWTLVPLKFTLSRGRIKCIIGVAKGKKQHEKKQVLKERTLKREAQKAIKNFRG